MEREELLERSREVRDGESRDFTDGVQRKVKRRAPTPPSPSVKDKAVEPILADNKAQQEPVRTGEEPTEHASACAQVTEVRSRPVAPPTSLLSSSAVSVPSPRSRATQTMDGSPAADSSSTQYKRLASSSQITSPTRRLPKVNTNHPWLTIIHPGPWTQLPRAPALQPNLSRSWYKPKVPPPNPFREVLNENTQKKDTAPEPADQADPPAAASHSGSDDRPDEVSDSVTGSSESVRDTDQIDKSDLEETGKTGDAPADVTEVAAAGPEVASSEAQSHILPRSLSEPATTSDPSQSSLLPADMMEENDHDEIMTCQSQTSCRENPFDRQSAMAESNTFQEVPSGQTPAPVHGFPLIRRKVLTDQDISTEGFQVEMKELDKQLEAMEQQGVELERNLRECTDDKEEEQMLKEWFSLIHDKHILVRRDTEMVHLTAQQKLEEKQTDVEYRLRCLLNKPESDWSQGDRSQERQLMDELVAIIEHRNQIICNFDQDKQRERGEDLLLEAIMKNKELQKEGLKELKKSEGKFKLTRVFKMMHHKAESTENPHTNKDEILS